MTKELGEMCLLALAMEEGRLEELAADLSTPAKVRNLAESLIGGKGFDVAERVLDRTLG